MSLKINRKSTFIRSVAMLTSGTVLAQGLSYLLMPVITRLFTPEDFGEFGVLMKVVGFVAVIGAASYEYAIPLPKDHKDAFHLYRLSLRILVRVILVTFLVGILYWLFAGQSASLLFYVIMIGLIGGATIFFSIGRFWSIRTEKFKQISLSSILNSGVNNVARLLTGLAGMGMVGLTISTFVGLLIGSVFYMRDGMKLLKTHSISVSKRKEGVLAKRYQAFPKVDLPHNLINTIRELLVAFFLLYYFDTAMYGSFDHSFRMLKIPLLLVGASIGQVLYSRLSKKFANKEKIHPELTKVIRLLIVGGIIPFTLIFCWGAPLFTFVFGNEWTLSGEIAAAIAPWLFANFIASTISIIPAIIGELKWFFWVSLVTTIIQIGCFAAYPLLSNYFEGDFIAVLRFISWMMFVQFFATTFWMLKKVKQHEE